MTDLIARLTKVADVWDTWGIGALLREAASALGQERDAVIEECTKLVRPLITKWLDLTYDQRAYSWHEMQTVIAELEKAIRSLKSSPQGEKGQDVHQAVTKDHERGASAALALPNAAGQEPSHYDAMSASSEGGRTNRAEPAPAAPAPGLGEPKRYLLCSDQAPGEAPGPRYLHEHVDGNWIEAKDYDALASRLGEVEQRHDLREEERDYFNRLWNAERENRLAVEAALAAEKERAGRQEIFMSEQVGTLRDPSVNVPWMRCSPDLPDYVKSLEDACDAKDQDGITMGNVRDLRESVEAERSRAGEMRKALEAFMALWDGNLALQLGKPMYAALHGARMALSRETGEKQ